MAWQAIGHSIESIMVLILEYYTASLNHVDGFLAIFDPLPPSCGSTGFFASPTQISYCFSKNPPSCDSNFFSNSSAFFKKLLKIGIRNAKDIRKDDHIFQVWESAFATPRPPVSRVVLEHKEPSGQTLIGGSVYKKVRAMSPKASPNFFNGAIGPKWKFRRKKMKNG